MGKAGKKSVGAGRLFGGIGAVFRTGESNLSPPEPDRQPRPRSRSPYRRGATRNPGAASSSATVPATASALPLSQEVPPIPTGEQIKMAIQALRDAHAKSKSKRWSYTNRHNEEVVVAERIQGILEGVEKYARVVDIAIQHSPEITALVWAGIRGILLVTLNHLQFMESLEVALATILEKLAACEFYSHVYSNLLKITLHSSATTQAFKDTLQTALPDFYKAVLAFTQKAQAYFKNSESVIGQLRNWFKQFLGEMKPLLNDLAEKEKAARECADRAMMHEVMEHSVYNRQAEGLLKDIVKEMAPLAKLEEILSVTSENLSVTKELKTILQRVSDEQAVYMQSLEKHQRQILLEASLDEDILQLKKDYLATHQYMEEFQLGLYVPAEATEQPYKSHRFDLLQRVQDFLKEGTTTVCLIQGPAGSGKSTFNHHLARLLWSQYERASDKTAVAIPLFISLYSIRIGNPDSHNQGLIATYFSQRGFTRQNIEEARRTRQFIFILDGYDEIERRECNVYSDNQLSLWRAKVIITSRSEYLGLGYHSRFHPPGQPQLLREYWLAPFSIDKINLYITQFLQAKQPGRSVEHYQNYLARPEIQDMISNPFLLRMIMAVEAAGYAGNLIKRVNLYTQFLHHCLNKAQERLRMIQLREDEYREFQKLCHENFIKQAEDYCQEFALELYRHQAIEVTYRPGKAISNQSNSTWQNFLGFDTGIQLLRFSAPLLRHGQSYRFLHKSLRDFLIAKSIWEDRLLPLCEADALLNQFSLVEDSGILDFIVEQATLELELQNNLLRYVEKSKVDTGVDRASANALTLLVKGGMKFTGYDLRGIRVPRADLSFGWFDGAQLQKSDLQHAKLHGAWLRGANLSGSKMDGVWFGERPAITLHGGNVCAACFSPDGRLCVAVGNGQRELSLWSLADKKLLRKTEIPVLAGKNDVHVSFSPDMTLLITWWRDGLVLFSVPELSIVRAAGRYYNWGCRVLIRWEITCDGDSGSRGALRK
ncbi:hypothetical protein BDZ91DRAFT_809488 [Kalaharituber pfeilii]|nr:hypothetical protein BDZ91DRAFT_809488 [Kalaharituber pfeilii]